MDAAELAAATALVHDPRTYEAEVPYAVLARLRDGPGVVTVAEPELPGWPQGPGYRLVLRHADVREVLSDAATYSSALGGTQIRDPATPKDLAFVRRMMLNMDPPEHSRLKFRPLRGRYGEHHRIRSPVDGARHPRAANRRARMPRSGG